MGMEERGALVVALVELVKSVVRYHWSGAPDYLWVILSVAAAIALTVGDEGATYQAILRGAVLGLTLTGLYKVAMRLAHNGK